MSNRPLILPKFPIADGASLAADYTSPVTIIQSLPGISYDIAWTGTPTGTFSVQVSNTYSDGQNGARVSAGNWNTLPPAAFIGTVPAPAGSAGNGFIDILGTEAYAIRLVYTRVSGTGTITIYTAAKVL